MILLIFLGFLPRLRSPAIWKEELIGEVAHQSEVCIFLILSGEGVLRSKLFYNRLVKSIWSCRVLWLSAGFDDDGESYQGGTQDSFCDVIKGSVYWLVEKERGDVSDGYGGSPMKNNLVTGDERG